MVEILSRINSGDLAMVICVPTLALVIGLVALASQVIKAVQRYREREIAATVVVEMLNRGIAPQEIALVLKAMGLEPPPERRVGRRFGRLFGSPAGQPVTPA